MNSDTRTPARVQLGDGLVQRGSCADTSSPPSVVTSARFSGTRQQSAGRTLGGDRQHLVGDGHLQIHAGLQQRPQRAHVLVLDVAAVLAQVQRDAVGAGALGEQRRMHRIGIARAARLAQRGHVIDVDAQRENACDS